MPSFYRLSSSCAQQDSNNKNNVTDDVLAALRESSWASYRVNLAPSHGFVFSPILRPTHACHGSTPPSTGTVDDWSSVQQAQQAQQSLRLCCAVIVNIIRSLQVLLDAHAQNQYAVCCMPPSNVIGTGRSPFQQNMPFCICEHLPPSLTWSSFPSSVIVTTTLISLLLPIVTPCVISNSYSPPPFVDSIFAASKER